MKIKLERGQKICPSCKGINAARQRICRHCSNEFIAKNTPIKNEVKNWKELENGSYIKVVQGTGPYFISKRDSEDGQAGERICLGSTGVYKVVGKDDLGIKVIGASVKNGGFCYLYMGPQKESNITDTILEPYRLKHVKKRKIK